MTNRAAPSENAALPRRNAGALARGVGARPRAPVSAYRAYPEKRRRKRAAGLSRRGTKNILIDRAGKLIYHYLNGFWEETTKKKLIVICLILTLALSVTALAACNDKNGSDGTRHTKTAGRRPLFCCRRMFRLDDACDVCARNRLCAEPRSLMRRCDQKAGRPLRTYAGMHPIVSPAPSHGRLCRDVTKSQPSVTHIYVET